MAATVVHENAISTELAGIETHILELLCTAAGDLPNIYIFVHKIVDPAAASADTFERVVNMADLEELETVRASAILNGAEYWRSAYMRKTFTDLEVAAQAKSDIDDYLHQLTQDWLTYSGEFKDNTDHSFPYPVGYKTNVENLSDAFYATYDTYLAAKETEAAAQDALTAAQADIAAGAPAVLRKNFAASIATGLATLQTEAISTESRFDILVGLSDALSNCQWFVDQVDTYIGLTAPTPDLTALQAARDTFLARVVSERSIGGAEFNNSTSDHGVKKAEADAEATASASAYSTLAGAVATAQSTLTAATQAKTDAWAALMTDPDSAYAELVAACPDFEPGWGYAFPPTP